MNTSILYCIVLMPVLLNACTFSPPSLPHTPVEGNWRLTWSDEFHGPEINPANWIFDIGGNGWGNEEWQFYTDLPGNARIEEGMLVIEAKEERFGSRSYTSARLKTQGLQEFRYGLIEARIRIPRGQGIWPAFWALGANIEEVRWPYCGEIDIMENIGREPRTIHGSVHGPGYAGGNSSSGGYTFADAAVADTFHIFAIVWEPEQIRWYVDGIHYHTVIPSHSEWVFDQPFFLILNVAVGGRWPGYPDDSTAFPQQMFIDWVRVYHTSDR